MSVRTIQWCLAAVFFVLGGWCLVSPGSVLMLTIEPAYRVEGDLVGMLVGAFGAQAMLAGVFAAFSRFERRTFLAVGIAVLPFFVFDYWAFAVAHILAPLGLLDVAGNVILIVLCVIGYRAAGDQDAAARAALSARDDAMSA